jgi:tetraacyldisaccharide 4'-kinase
MSWLGRKSELLGPTEFHDLVSGRRSGVGPACLRMGLRLVEFFYTAAVQWRNHRYDCDASTSHRVGVPVISVGNLTLGGTGKTPMVEWLVRQFLAHGKHPAVISRGYGADDGACNDEAMELEKKLPGVPHLQNPDRVAAAQMAIEKYNSQVIVLDDGFQHRRIARDFDIVLLDASEPFGFGHVFPRGTLREPVAELKRADAVVLTRADMLDADRRAAIWEVVHQYAPKALCAEAAHVPQSLMACNGRRESAAAIRDGSIAAFCGLGNPAGFRHTLEVCGCRVAAFREFPDHHRYTPADVASLDDWSRSLDVSAVVCSMKDLVKLSVDQLGGRPLWAVAIEMEFLAGQDLLEKRLAQW